MASLRVLLAAALSCVVLSVSEDTDKLSSLQVPPRESLLAADCRFSRCSRPVQKSTTGDKDPVAITVTLEIKHDRVDDFLNAMTIDAAGTRQEPGNLRFDVLQDLEKESIFHLYEVYKDDAADTAHQSTEHFKAWTDFYATDGVVELTAAKSHVIDFTPWMQMQELAAPPFVLTVDLEIKPDRVDDFLKAIAINAEASRLEAGNFRFDVLKDREKENVFHFYEIYKDEEAFAAHSASAHFKAYLDDFAKDGIANQVVYKSLAMDFTMGMLSQPAIDPISITI